MAKTKKEKIILKDKYLKEIKLAKALIVVKPTKITPNEANKFRMDIFEADAKFNVVKNSIFKMALKEANLPEIEELNLGENAVIAIREDIINPSKSLKKFIEETTTKTEGPRIEIVAGIMDGQKLSKEQVLELADMPDFKGSISMVLGILDSSLAGVLNVLEDPVRSVATILDLAFEKK